MDKTYLAGLQIEMAQQVQIPPHGAGYQPRPGDVIFGLDAQYVQNRAYVALHVRAWEGQAVGTFVGLARVEVPYVSGFFCFREGPPLLAMIQTAQSRLSLAPDLILVDGHGIAHPRRFGLACWVGVETQVPTFGCAKRSLMWYNGKVARKRGNCLWIRDQGEIVGAALVTQDDTKPVFVSVGHGVSLQVATGAVLNLSRYRIPEPLRKADQGARACARGTPLEGVDFWGDVVVIPAHQERK
jgi:deoxyribonuclease V